MIKNFYELKSNFDDDGCCILNLRVCLPKKISSHDFLNYLFDLDNSSKAGTTSRLLECLCIEKDTDILEIKGRLRPGYRYKLNEIRGKLGKLGIFPLEKQKYANFFEKAFSLADKLKQKNKK